MAKKLQVPKKLGSFSISCGTITFSRRTLLRGVSELVAAAL
jgi:hypothetical protein